MNTTRLAALAAGTLTATTLVLSGSTTTAHAGAACTASFAANHAFCGGAGNSTSGTAFRITKQWPDANRTYLPTSANPTQQVTVGPGQRLGGPGGGGTDVDGFRVPDRCTASIRLTGSNVTRTAGWWKISDGEVAVLTAMRCEA